MLFNNKRPEDEFMQEPGAIKRPSSPAAPSSAEAISVAPRKINAGPTRSVIDAWLNITGNLHSEGEVQVDGRITGDIRCAHLIVGREAVVEGNITAEEVVVRGKVSGVIRATRVILQDSAHVESDIFHKRLSIEEGAEFDGMSRRCEDPMNMELPVAKPKLNGSANGKHHHKDAVAVA
ncbi:MAG TPA: polymer-forming cytoskeletal protein [Hyphomicrobiaceae bacterium]|jgi:cytoskeletal protein CcmA (bactofilin family)|nr:polymer-forming cytoskeletal protein [Hyphomicrobiaceae bacterium]